jgi:hypothetical protein
VTRCLSPADVAFMKTTTIVTPFGTWSVPRGFGAAYKRIAAIHARLLAADRPGQVIQMVRDLLGLVGFDATPEAIAEWDARKRVEAHVFAAYEHSRASDNPIPIHPKLAWLPAPWAGSGKGVVFGDPTVLR